MVHPSLFYDLAYAGTRIGLHEAGIDREQCLVLIDSLTPGMVEAAAQTAKIAIPEFTPDANGSILGAILAFLGSAEGQALIAALIQLLLGLAGGAAAAKALLKKLSAG